MLAGRYRLDAVLGRGGMGVVFRARDEGAGAAPVAVKLLRAEFALEQVFAKRFVREAKAAAAIRHPNVVEVRDLGVEPDGTIYQVLQLLDGVSLADHLEVAGALTVERTLEIVLPVMAALEAAHATGVVHRDLKPDNVFLARRGGEIVPTLLDFGIAKLLDGNASAATHTGSILGTPAYMAPEQAQGTKEQGPAIDVWAMGIVTYECLTGTTPFTGASPTQVLVRILTETARRADEECASVPSGIADVIARALARHPGERFGSIAELADALRTAAVRAGLAVPEAGRTSTMHPFALLARTRPETGRAETGETVDDPARHVAATVQAELGSGAPRRTPITPTTRAGSVAGDATRRDEAPATPARFPGAAPARPARGRWVAAGIGLAALGGLAALAAGMGSAPDASADEEVAEPAWSDAEPPPAPEAPAEPPAAVPEEPSSAAPEEIAPETAEETAEEEAEEAEEAATPRLRRPAAARSEPEQDDEAAPPVTVEAPPARPTGRSLPGVVDEW